MTRSEGRATTIPPAAPDRHRSEHPLVLNRRLDWAVAVVLSLVTAVAFILMAFHGTRGAIQRLNGRFLHLMVESRSSSLTAVAKALNVVGLVYVTLPIRLVVAGFLAFRRRWWHLLAFASAVVISELCIGPIKGLYDEPRPPGSLVGTTGASFPSGHAVAASVTVVAIVIALFPPKRRGLWGTLAVFFAVLMGLSRAYLAAHWLWDAISGVLLGTSAAIWTALVVQAIRDTRTGRRPPSPG